MVGTFTEKFCRKIPITQKNNNCWPILARPKIGHFLGTYGTYECKWQMRAERGNPKIAHLRPFLGTSRKSK